VPPVVPHWPPHQIEPQQLPGPVLVVVLVEELVLVWLVFVVLVEEELDPPGTPRSSSQRMIAPPPATPTATLSSLSIRRGEYTGVVARKRAQAYQPSPNSVA